MLPMICYGQEAKVEHKTKMDIFASEEGISVKFIDYKLEPVIGDKGLYHEVNVLIRKMIKNDEHKFFYRIESKRNGVDNAVAFVEYSDLKKIRESIDYLKNESTSDMELLPDYLENKYTSEDYFYVGYYIEKKKITWFIRLDRFGTNKTILFKTCEPIIKTFDEAISKIEELMK